MKKLLLTILKTIIFFLGWALLAGFIPIPNSANPAIWRFWAECIPFLSIIGLTFIFWLIEKRKIHIQFASQPAKNALIGLVTGAIWLFASVTILIVSGVMKINGSNQIPMLWLWLLSAFFNTMMQEMLVRGYLYQMIKSNYNIVAATIVSTALFTFMHGGAFDAGAIAVMNVFTMSLFMTVVLEYTKMLLTPIITHFLWNGIGAIILDGVSLAEDYPHLFNATFNGDSLLSGGIYKIEGSIVVLFMNVLFAVGFLVALRKRQI